MEKGRREEGVGEGGEGEGRGGGKAQCLHTTLSLELQLRKNCINHLYFPTTLRILSRLRLTRQQHEFMKLMVLRVIVL